MLGFLIAIVAGFLVPKADDSLSRPFAEAVRNVVKVEEREIRLTSFIIVMLLASVLCALLDTGSAMGVLLGGALGYFGPRLSAAAGSAFDAKR